MRIKKVTKAQKDQGTCGRCGTEIKKGDSYSWIKFYRSRSKRVRCSKCSFRPSELTESKMSQVYAAQESFEDQVDGWDGGLDDLKTLADEVCDEVRDVASEYQEAADAMGDAGEELREKGDELESWADEIESVKDDLDDDAIERDDNGEPTDDALFEDWKDDCVSVLRDVIENCPVD